MVALLLKAQFLVRLLKLYRALNGEKIAVQKSKTVIYSFNRQQ